jgi:hypothetical protein
MTVKPLKDVPRLMMRDVLAVEAACRAVESSKWFHYVFLWLNTRSRTSPRNLSPGPVGG